MRRAVVAGIFFLTLISCLAQESAQRDYTKLAAEGDLVVHNFKFHSGETLPDLHLHYATWGTPKKNAAGEITNAVLLLHGTMGTGVGFGNPNAAVPGPHPMLGPGGAVDSTIYFVIAPDTIGAGKSLEAERWDAHALSALQPGGILPQRRNSSSSIWECITYVPSWAFPWAGGRRGSGACNTRNSWTRWCR